MSGRSAASSAELEAFRAMLDTVRQRRREAFLAHRGDGQAVETEGWMRFSGKRVAPPGTNDGWIPEQALKPSPLHGPHTVDSPCLEVAERVPDLHAGQVLMVSVPGWYRCTKSGPEPRPKDLYLHDHGGRLFAHGVADRKACPVATAAVPA